MFPPDFLAAAEAVLGACRARGWQVTTAESCTGGLIAGLLTAIGGSSDVVDGGAVTYSNAAKTRMLGVPAALIAAHGAVSEEVARAMAEGARRTAGVDLAVAVTGVAGPGGGTAEKPVGLVYAAVSDADGTDWIEKRFPGDRGSVRFFASHQGLDLVRRRLM